MPEFLTLLPPPEALELFLSRLPIHPAPEWIPTAQAVGRAVFEAVRAPHPLPEFNRSTVDGYAVRSVDTHGAQESLPVYLSLRGEIPMGVAPPFEIGETQCALIHTGGMLPPGTDAVVMVEDTQISRKGEIEILKPAANGENVILVGEDVAQDEAVISPGKRLRPADIGGLMALGITRIKAAAKPRVAVISSGDEVVPPDRDPAPGQVRDINSYTLQALIDQAGGSPVVYGIIPDNRQALNQAVSRALEECDLVVITAGSSASTRDLTAEVIDAQGEPGVLVHGVNVRPGKPTILGIAREKGLIGLPGNPVSALVIAGLFVVPAVRVLSGLPPHRRTARVSAELSINLASQAGREDWIPVRLVGDRAEPVFGKSNLIFLLSRADGLIRVPADANGLETGQEVTVHLFDC